MKFKDQLSKLDKNASAEREKMNIGEMAWHCQSSLIILLGKNAYRTNPSGLFKVLFKKYLYNDKPLKKGLPIAKFLKVKNTKDLSQEKNELQASINEAYQTRTKTEWAPEPSFANLTWQQWRQMEYNHLDYHFKKFEV